MEATLLSAPTTTSTGVSLREGMPPFSPRNLVSLSQLSAKDKDKIFRMIIDNEATVRKTEDGNFVCDVRFFAPKVRKTEFMEPQISTGSDYDSSLANVHDAFPIEERLRIINERMYIEVTISGVPEFHYNIYTRFVGLSANHKQIVRPKHRLLAWVMKTIEDIYDARFIYEKHDVDRDDEASVANPLIALFPAFVVRRLSTILGLRPIVEQTCWDLLYNVNMYRGEYLEVEMFARFLQEFYDQDDLLFFLYVRSVISNLLRISFKSRWTKPETAAKILSKPFCLSYRECILVAKNIFGAENDQMVKDLLAIIIPELVGQRTDTSDTRRIDICQFLHLAVVAYHQTQYQASQDALSIQSSSQASSSNLAGPNRLGQHGGGIALNAMGNSAMSMSNLMEDLPRYPPKNNKGPIIPNIPPSAPSEAIYMSKYRPDLEIEAQVVSNLSVDSDQPSYTPSLRAYANPIGMFKSEVADSRSSSKIDSFDLDFQNNPEASVIAPATTQSHEIYENSIVGLSKEQQVVAPTSSDTTQTAAQNIISTNSISNDNKLSNSSSIKRSADVADENIHILDETGNWVVPIDSKSSVKISDLSTKTISTDATKSSSRSDSPVLEESKLQAENIRTLPVSSQSGVGSNERPEVGSGGGGSKPDEHQQQSPANVNIADIINKFEHTTTPLAVERPDSLKTYMAHAPHGDAHFHHSKDVVVSQHAPSFHHEKADHHHVGVTSSGGGVDDAESAAINTEKNQESQEVRAGDDTNSNDKDNEGKGHNGNSNADQTNDNDNDDGAAIFTELQVQRESEFLSFLCEPIGNGEYSVEVVDFVVEHLAAALRTHINDAIAEVSDTIKDASDYDAALVSLLEADNVAEGFIEYRNELIQHKLEELGTNE